MSVLLTCNTSANVIHSLSGGGWNDPFDRNTTGSMIVRLHDADGQTEDHERLNGVHFADDIRQVDVPGSEFAFALGDQQIRHVTVSPRRPETFNTIELGKGDDNPAPIVSAVTIERSQSMLQRLSRRNRRHLIQASCSRVKSG